MKLATFDDGSIKTGIIVGDSIIETGFAGTMIDLIARWEELRPQMAARAAAGGGRPLASIRLCAPVLKPAKIWAIGLNYADHIEESKMATPERQIWFTKADRRAHV